MSDGKDAAGPQSGGSSSPKRGHWRPGRGSLALAQQPTIFDQIQPGAQPLSSAVEAAAKFGRIGASAGKTANVFMAVMAGAGMEWVPGDEPTPAEPKPAAGPAPTLPTIPTRAAATVEPPTEAPPPTAPAPPQPPQRSEPPATTDQTIPEGLASYERRDAPAWFVDRLRVWWPPFEPRSYQHWMRLEGELKKAHGESPTDPRSPEEFDRQRLRWTWEELVAHMESVRLIYDTPSGKRGRPPKTTADGWTCSQWLAAEFTRHPEYRSLTDAELTELPGCRWAESTVRTCTTRKAQRQLEKRELEERRRREADDLRDGLETGAVRFTNRKTTVGQQKRRNPADQSAELAERNHDAAAEAFLANAEPKRRRPK